jgi:hypothetical protein
MLNKWKKERASFSNGKLLSANQLEELPILTAIPDSEKSEVNSLITDLRKSISDALDYFFKIDSKGVFASPVRLFYISLTLHHPYILLHCRFPSLATRILSKIHVTSLLSESTLRDIELLISSKMIFSLCSKIASNSITKPGTNIM